MAPAHRSKETICDHSKKRKEKFAATAKSARKTSAAIAERRENIRGYSRAQRKYPLP